MTHKYPENVQIGLGDFTSSNWRKVLDSAEREGYSSMWQAFSGVAQQAINDSQNERGKVLWLLADICSMMLSPKSQNEPFKPIFVIEGKRSILSEDFSESDIQFFTDILDAVDEPWLKARVSDVLWLLKKPRESQFALSAIDAYRSIPLDTKTWIRGGRECWERAVSLAFLLRGGAGTRLNEMESSILSAIDDATHNDGHLAFWLADLLDSNGLGRDKRTHVAQILEGFAREFENIGDLHRARDYFSGAVKWFGRAGDELKAAEMTAAQAEAWVKEAIARASSEQPSHMVAATFYENAIQTYRTIPKKHRASYLVDERLAELHKHLSDSSEKSLNEMSQIRTPGIDISEMVENAQNLVHNKSVIEALKAFANLHRGADAKQLRDQAMKQLRDFPLQTMFPATVVSSDGRVIAKRPGMSLGSSPSDEDEIVIRAEMIKSYGMFVSIMVQGDVWPAHEVMLLEHRLREDDFVSLANQSPIIPKGRGRLFGKALFAGYERDFITALHLLVPQIEHLVRWHLKQAGEKTTTLSSMGIETENGLSTLMELPKVKEVLGENLVFEIRALFCDAFGPNFRNEIAHGLIDENACHSAYAIYAWWFALRLVFNTWWNRTRQSN